MPLKPEQQARFDATCAKIREGKSLRTACKPKAMPDQTTFHKWIEEDESGALSMQYAHAREVRADAIFEDILNIADNRRDDDPTKINRARLRIDARKWNLARMQPKKYGDKLDLDVKGDLNLGVDVVITPHELIQERLAQIAKRSGNDS